MAKQKSKAAQPAKSRRKAATKGEERRRAARLERSIDVHYRAGDQPYRRGSTVDFSRTGARLLLEGPLESAGDVHMHLDLEPRLKLTLRAQMVWQQSSKKGFEAGLTFCLPPEVDSRLGRWLNKQLKVS